MNPERYRSLRAEVLAAAPSNGDADGAGPLPVLQRIVETAARVCGVGAAGLTVMGSPDAAGTARRDLLALAGRAAEAAEGVQLTTGEGPCVDALRSGRPVLVPDLDLDPRWPAFVAAAREHGVSAVFSFPLTAGTAGIGALDLLRTTPGSLTPAELADALLLTRLADEVLVEWLARAELDWLPNSHGAVHVASGMVAYALGLPPEEALLLMRARAFADGITVDALARAIADRRLPARLEPPDAGTDR